MLPVTYINYYKRCLGKGLLLVLALFLSIPSSILADNIPGCQDTKIPTDYNGVFADDDITKENLEIINGLETLKTGAQTIDPNNIVIPFTQEVTVTFLYVNACNISDLGWVYYSECAGYLDRSDGKFDWDQVPTYKKHPIFVKIQDQPCHGELGDGIFDVNYGLNGNFPTTNELLLSNYNDGSGSTDQHTLVRTPYKFQVDGDNVVTTKDMKKSLGTINGGSEIVFFISSASRWDATNNRNNVFFTKTAWNRDVYKTSYPGPPYIYPASFNKIYQLNGTNVPHECLQSNTACTPAANSARLLSNGWLDQQAVDRMSQQYGITLSGNVTKTITPFRDNSTNPRPPAGYVNGPLSHVIVGAPVNDSKQWILGFEDTSTGGDYDINDLAFRIERQTGGKAELKSDKAIEVGADDYYTSVTFEVYDNMPGGTCATQAWIEYTVSIDNGVDADNNGTWDHSVTLAKKGDWDVIKESSLSKTKGADITNWTYGSPPLTYRSKRIDFAGLGMIGRQLRWKAVLHSNNDLCAPQIINVFPTGTVATHGFFSRASPSIQTNMSYSGSYETPARALPYWTDKTVLHGHLTATRLYDPADPSNISSVTVEKWDAGEKLRTTSPVERKIYYPSITINTVTDEVIGTGDAIVIDSIKQGSKQFTGALAHHPISATSVVITDQTEKFTDSHTDVLTGLLGGFGKINRFTGDFDLTFFSPPWKDVPVKASYKWYETSQTLKEFNTTNITETMLGMNSTYVLNGTGKKRHLYNFYKDYDPNCTIVGSDPNCDTVYDDKDRTFLINWVRGYKDGVSTPKEWLLGPIDHSVPAVQTPPGIPGWYYGTAVTKADRDLFDTFVKAQWERPTMIYVGSRDGMLHAFDGGNFRWGYYDNDTFKWGDNPKTTAIKEYRGYFKWSGDTSATADYGTGIEKWAYIPANLISRLKNNLMSAEDQAYVDASPAISDVYINNAWTTVLLSAEGNGGDTVYCLDVTDPLGPKFLWEFADPDLYRSRSSPAVGVIGRIAPGKWAAFFVSGITYDNTLYPSVYLIDIENGSVIQRIFLGAEPNSIQGVPNSVPAGIGGVPSGQPAVVDSDGDGFLDRMYIGTDKGYLYKVNIPNDHSDLSGYTQSVINTDLGGLDRHPIHASPVVVVQNTYNHEKLETKVKILFGTGDSPYFNDYTTGTKYHFFSYVDTVPAPQCKVCTSTGIVSLDWFYELPVGERIFASAFAAAGSIYFGTSTAETEDPCEGSGKPTANSGRLYVMKIATGELVTPEPISTGNITTAPVVDDEHLYVKIPTGTIATKGPYNNALPGEPLSSISSWREIFNKDVSLTPTVTATPSL